MPMRAKPAGAVGAADPRYSDTGADAQMLCLTSDNFADDLVSRYQILNSLRQVAFGDMKIGAAHATGANSQQDVALCDRRLWNIEDSEWLSWAFQNSGAHLISHAPLRRNTVSSFITIQLAGK